MKGKGKGVLEISQVDSLGTVSSIPGGLYTSGAVHRPWSVRDHIMMS
jgi:hypothetical protein